MCVNRSGNAPAIRTVSAGSTGRGVGPTVAGRITLRGDTDFTHTAQLDGWTKPGSTLFWGWMLIPKCGVGRVLVGAILAAFGALPSMNFDRAAKPPERVKEQIVVPKRVI